MAPDRSMRIVCAVDVQVLSLQQGGQAMDGGAYIWMIVVLVSLHWFFYEPVYTKPISQNVCFQVTRGK